MPKTWLAMADNGGVWVTANAHSREAFIEVEVRTPDGKAEAVTMNVDAAEYLVCSLSESIQWLKQAGK